MTAEFKVDCKMRLDDGVDPQLIIKAVLKSTGKKPNPCKYAIAILKNWAAEGIKTLEQQEATEKVTPLYKKTKVSSDWRDF